VNFDWHAFLLENWHSMFAQLFKAYGLDPIEVDTEIGRRIAVAWHGVLEEQAQLGAGVCGRAYEYWIELLRQMGQR
jgi:hypothetical protein